jgi:DNA-binding CsgD family transcriptional regulator
MPPMQRGLDSAMNSSGRTKYNQGVWSRHEQTLAEGFCLTPGEASVARECIKGLTNKEIAAGLGISHETVNKHLDHVFRKANVRSRMELSARLLVRM